MSCPPGFSARRCMGCQPARFRTEPESSSAERKSCETKGLYERPDVSPQGGLAQASQARAGMSVIALAMRRVKPEGGCGLEGISKLVLASAIVVPHCNRVLRS